MRFATSLGYKVTPSVVLGDRIRERQKMDTYYFATSGATFTGRTVPVKGTPSEWFRATARYYRALGDEVTAIKWDKQAEIEEVYERGQA